jgi:hypothetical protein
MSLPACQQRALDRMEGALRASEPHLASMYTIFGRLNAGESIGTERLTRKRLRLQPGTTMYAIVLVPVIFAAIIVGALLGGTRSTAACEASYSVGGVSPLSSRLSCPVSGKTVKVAVRKTISATARLACTAGQAARFITLSGHEQAVPPAARAYATAAGPPGAC